MSRFFSRKIVRATPPCRARGSTRPRAYSRQLAEWGIAEFGVARSFYAVLHASDAARASKGFVAKSHEGTEVMFARHFFKTKPVDEQFKGLFKRLRDARIKADYKYDVEFTRADAEYWFERARAFFAAIEAGTPQWLAEQK